MRSVSEFVSGNGSDYQTAPAKVMKQPTAGKYGKTIGNPTLSEEAAKVYDELKAKYSNMDFRLVSMDMIGMAKQMAAGMSNPDKMVVLIDEEKLEKMATDPKFRQEIEGKIMSAQNQMPQLTQMMQKNSAIRQVGMEFGKDGRASFFAVVDKSFKDLNARLLEKRAEKKAEKKAEAKKEAKAELEEKLYGREDCEIITAGSIEELMQKIDDYMFVQRSDQVMTDQEMQIGQNIDFKG